MLTLLCAMQLAQADSLKWTASGDLPSLAPGDYMAELHAAAEAWTIDTEICGPVPLLEWTDDPEQAVLRIETVSELEEGVDMLTQPCPDSEDTCLVQLSEGAPWALPAEAVEAECLDRIHLRYQAAHSMGHALGAGHVGDGGLITDSSVLQALMYWQAPCREEVAINEHDTEQLEIDWSVPSIAGVRDGGSIWLEPGETVELRIEGPEIQSVDWHVDGQPAGTGPTLTLGPVTDRLAVDASVTYIHSLCEEQVQALSASLQPTRPGAVLPQDQVESSGCRTAPGSGRGAGLLILLGVLVSGFGRSRRFLAS